MVRLNKHNKLDVDENVVLTLQVFNGVLDTLDVS